MTDRFRSPLDRRALLAERTQHGEALGERGHELLVVGRHSIAGPGTTASPFRSRRRLGTSCGQDSR
jgi:hypothetical protein